MSQRPYFSVEMTVVSEQTAIITIFGEHDLFTKDQVLETLECAQHWTNVIVDLTSCEFLDSSVIGVLFAAHYAPQAACERFELIAPETAGFVDRALDLMGVREVIRTHKSIEAALRSVGDADPVADQSAG
jgi:anti-anti-sigma factor